jgi:hypothetical protein
VLEFDTVGECRFEGESTVDDRCQQDEAAALEQLRAGWTQFVVADKSTFLAAATIGGFASCVELLSCLEMARDVNNGDSNSRGPQTTEAMRQRAPGVTVGVGHDPITLGQMPGRGSR